MHIDHTHAELDLQQPQHAHHAVGIHLPLHKMDRIFYDCIKHIKCKYKWWIAFHLLKMILVIFLMAIDYYLLNGFKDVRVFIMFLVSAIASLLQLIAKLMYRILVLNNNILLLKISSHLDHSSQQVINSDPNQIKNCVSLREYNHQTNSLISQTFYFNSLNQARQKQLTSAIKQQSHKRKRWLYVCKKLADIFGVLSMFYTLYVLMNGLGTNALEFLVMYGQFIVEFVSQLVLLGILLFIALLPLVLIGLGLKFCYNNCRCEQNWWKFTPSQQKRQLPDQMKITQKMINQSDGLCTICLQEFKVNQSVIVLKCSNKHIFHPQCIETWIDYRRTCPNCRLPIKTN